MRILHSLPFLFVVLALGCSEDNRTGGSDPGESATGGSRGTGGFTGPTGGHWGWVDEDASAGGSGGSSADGSSGSEAGAKLDGGADGPGTPAVIDYKTANIYTTAKSGGNLVKTAGTLKKDGSASGSVIEVNSNKLQEFIGFGSSITEASAAVFNSLSDAKRTEVLNAMYKPHPDGANYVLNRAHIGSCDFSSGNYSFSYKQDLSDFSIDPDRKVKGGTGSGTWNVQAGGPGMLEYMKRANEVTGGKLKVIGSPWSPPAFMRSNDSLYGKGRLRKEMYPTYADYFVKYVQAYKKEGLTIWALTPQNEPNVCGDHWETHCMSPEESAEFVGGHLGPKLQAAGLGDVHIFGFDHNKGEGQLLQFARAAYNNAAYSKYFKGMAHHWYFRADEFFPEELDQAYEVNRDKLLIATEQSIDSFTTDNAYNAAWKNDGWWWENNAPDWTHGPKAKAVGRYAKAIITDLNHHTSGWITWNAALFKAGGPSHKSNSCTADVMVDNGDVYYTPTFYVMQHFTRFIRPGAFILPSRGAEGMGLMSVAAINANDSVTVAVFNETDQSKSFTVKYKNYTVPMQMPAFSIQTLELQ